MHADLQNRSGIPVAATGMNLGDHYRMAQAKISDSMDRWA
jgi:hypothetical protein